MEKNTKIYIAGFAIIAIMCFTILAVGVADGKSFGGADDGAGEVVEEINPGYEPWTETIYAYYSIPDETASMLFALQAAIGAIIIGYFIGVTRARKE